MEKDSRRCKICEFETLTAAEFTAAKFLSLIGKSTGAKEEDSEKRYVHRSNYRRNTRIHVGKIE